MKIRNGFVSNSSSSSFLITSVMHDITSVEQVEKMLPDFIEMYSYGYGEKRTLTRKELAEIIFPLLTPMTLEEAANFDLDNGYQGDDEDRVISPRAIDKFCVKMVKSDDVLSQLYDQDATTRDMVKEHFHFYKLEVGDDDALGSGLEHDFIPLIATERYNHH
jgi:hypothetical protein